LLERLRHLRLKFWQEKCSFGSFCLGSYGCRFLFILL
jgi:hypothetical protein